MKEDRKKITLFVPEEVHKPARVKIAGLDTSFQQVVLELLREWTLGKRQVALPPAKVDPPSQFSEDLDRLQWILENGTSDDRTWIRGNLKNFEEAIRSRKPHLAQPSFRKRAGG